MASARQWRLTSRRGPKGTYWSLRTGRGADRQALSLSYLSEEGLAFPSKRGTMYGDQGWKKALKSAAERAKIKRRVYPYLLRDSFATIAWLQGIPLDIARRVMRHTAESRVLEEVYCRPRPEEVARRMEGFDIG